MPDIELSDGKKISFSKTIDGFEIFTKSKKNYNQPPYLI